MEETVIFGYEKNKLLHLEMSKITVIFQDKKKNNCYIWGYGIQRHFQQYFSYIVAVSSIGGGNRSTLSKPPTCRKSLTNFIKHHVEHHNPNPGMLTLVSKVFQSPSVMQWLGELISSMVVRIVGSDQIIDYLFGICAFSTRHSTLMSNIKEILGGLVSV